MNYSQKRDAISYKLGEQFLTQLSDDIRTVISDSDMPKQDKDVLRKALKLITSYADDLHGH